MPSTTATSADGTLGAKARRAKMSARAARPMARVTRLVDSELPHQHLELAEEAGAAALDAEAACTAAPRR